MMKTTLTQSLIMSFLVAGMFAKPMEKNFGKYHALSQGSRREREEQPLTRENSLLHSGDPNAYVRLAVEPNQYLEESRSSRYEIEEQPLTRENSLLHSGDPNAYVRLTVEPNQYLEERRTPLLDKPEGSSKGKKSSGLSRFFRKFTLGSTSAQDTSHLEQSDLPSPATLITWNKVSKMSSNAQQNVMMEFAQQLRIDEDPLTHQQVKSLMQAFSDYVADVKKESKFRQTFRDVFAGVKHQADDENLTFQFILALARMTQVQATLPRNLGARSAYVRETFSGAIKIWIEQLKTRNQKLHDFGQILVDRWKVLRTTPTNPQGSTHSRR